MARIFKHHYTRLNPKTGRRQLRKTKNWYIEYRDEHGRKIRVPGFKDRKATERKATELESEVIRRQRGERPRRLHDGPQETLTDHLAAYRADMEGRGLTADHVSQATVAIARMFAGIGAEYPSDIERGRLEAWLADQRRAGLSAQTVNHYLKRLRAFTRWLVDKGRIDSDPTRGVRAANVEGDRRRERRALTDDEFERMIQAARRSKVIYRGLAGVDRARLYLLAAYTGLRRSELFSLTRASFSLDAQPPTITVEARASKRRRRDVLPLPGWLANEARGWIRRLRPSDRLWLSTRWFKTAAMLRIDLEAAKIPFEDERGRVFDFHALRGHHATQLARAGVPLAQAQRLMRHSTPILTAKVYTHLEIEDLAAEVEKVKPPKR